MTDECRPAAGAADGSLHWLLDTDAGHHNMAVWIPTPQACWAMNGRLWYPSDLHKAGLTYHAPASPDDATERARLEREVKRLQGQIDAQAKPVAGDPVFMVLHELQQENIRLRGSLERIARFDHKNAVPWTHQAAADAYWLALDGCRLIARAALTPGGAS